MELDALLAIIIPFVLVAILMAVLIIAFFAPEGSVVDATYITGLEAINIALLVFWLHAVKTKPKEYVERFLYKHALIPCFIFVFALVCASSLMGYLTALNILSSIATLFICTFTLFVNLFLVAISIMGQKS